MIKTIILYQIEKQGITMINMDRISEASYIIWQEDGNIFAQNGLTGIIDYVGNDAATVINNTINTLSSGGKIFIKNETYIITSSLTIAANYITIQGESWKTILQLGANVNVITVNAAPSQAASWYLEFKDFKIDGKKSAYNTGNGIDGNMRRSLFERLWIIDTPQDGIRYDIGTGCVVKSCIIETPGRYGIVPLGTDSHIVNSTIAQAADAGIYLKASATFIEHCHLWGNLHGMRMAPEASVVNCIIHCCYIENNVNSGIEIIDYSVWDSVIKGNIFWKNGTGLDSTYDDIYIKPTSPYVFKNNVITDNIFQGGGKTRYAINMVVRDDNCIISNNVTKSHAVGEFVYTGTGHIIKNNKGYKTESNILSDTFAIDSTGIKTITIPHGLAITPNVQDCYLTVVKNTNATDCAYNLLMIDSVDATNTIAKINISIASKTVGATAKLALKVGNP